MNEQPAGGPPPTRILALVGDLFFAVRIGNTLRPLGYRSYHSGKWHVQGAPNPVADGGFDRSYYLGLSGEHVAIYKGLPVEFAGIHMSRVESVTPLKKTDVPSWFLPRLEEGIRVSSLADARKRLDDLPRATATPTPRASPSTTARSSPRKSP